jgi:maltose O-acetyltransferase
MRVPDFVWIIYYNVVLNSIIEAKWFPRPLRPWAYRRLGIDCGECFLMADIFFDGKEIRSVRIGDGVVVNNRVYIDASAPVTIGDRVGIAAGVRIITADHVMGGRSQRWADLTPAPVTIGAGAWIGADATLMPGVTIGEGAVIGTGSLVTRDCEPDGVYVGRPARLVRYLEVDSGAERATVTDLEGIA